MARLLLWILGVALVCAGLFVSAVSYLLQHLAMALTLVSLPIVAYAIWSLFTVNLPDRSDGEQFDE